MASVSAFVLAAVFLGEQSLTNGLVAPSPPEDPFRWLETVNSTRVMEWVHRQDERTLRALGDPASSPLYPRLLDILQSTDKIPRVSVHGQYLYNFWTDSNYTRGIWRRTTLEEYRKPVATWESVFDLDALSEHEHTPWVWKGCRWLDEGPTATADVCLMKLSRGGGDAVVVREFDVASKAFVPPPQGFWLPAAKSSVSYRDRNHLLVGTDTGPGSLTDSGYPRTVRLWQRGTNFSESTLVFEGKASDVSVSAWRSYEQDGQIYDWHSRSTSFFESERWVRIASDGDQGTFHKLDVPSTAEVATFADQLILMLKSDFQTAAGASLRSGMVAAAPVTTVLNSPHLVNWTVLFEPTTNRSCSSYASTRHYIVLKVLDAVKTQLVPLKYASGQWTPSDSPSEIFTAALSVSAFNASSDSLWVSSQSFLQPVTLSLAPSAENPGVMQEIRKMPAMFNTTGLHVSQRWVRSKDGTPVPYFLVKKAHAATTRPTLLYGYGGFEISYRPFYSPTLGAAWLEKGGAYALANIRGGGEFGPEWHQAAMREGKHLSYEDFAAVAEDLVLSNVTTPAQLGAKGGSNGGLLVGNMLVQYPHLFNAIICSVPLLDMKRYTKLLAGSSWIGEYGDPDNATDWAFLNASSPYHNVNKSADYPPVLFMTSTADDRVHPGHARKMAAKLQAEVPRSANHTFFYESTEGGHSSALPKQTAFELALQYTFLARELGLDVAA